LTRLEEHGNLPIQESGELLPPLAGMKHRLGRFLSATGLIVAIAGVAAVPAQGEMTSTQLRPYLCKTVGGGKFVRIKSFPGERIDRRLLRDIRWMKRRYKIFITDGYSTDPVHAANGEHPLGLAVDIVPNRAEGGTWRLVGKLARRFEPDQNHVRLPFRWIGYNGDPNHGRGNHLHLSWAHSRKTRFGHPVRWVYTRFCPEKPDDDGTQNSGGDGGGSSGGTGAGKAAWPGVSERERSRIAPPVPESH
jgi:hypothetical protein